MTSQPASGASGVKPPPDRLYGRRRSHPLRDRQERLISETLPRLRLRDEEIASPPLPAWLEVGFGGGEHALAQAAANPGVTFIACEVFENGICSLLARLVPEGGEGSAPLPDNLRIWDADARELLRQLPGESIQRLFLLFPDPWPKARHAKRRFVHPALLTAVARVLAVGGEWRIASDDPTYQDWVDGVLGAQDLFRLVSRSAGAPPESPVAWPPTRYEAKARAAGRRPVYWTLERLTSAWI
ncbi:MAG TPA: tRNA (guanine(46)-N(7))-methyltransferase TrmB [Acetobacteraceae bacterium]|nr:tRNA (guanine(46)-N(7))-methyltransferase TrmB [Acetobacteraceae bacterium]